MPTVRLGNPSPVHPGTSGKSVTTANIPEIYTASERLRTVLHADGLWVQHSSAAAPEWVECDDDPELARAIAQATGCAIGRPDGWGE